MFAANSGAVSEEKTYIEDVFSTYLYTGNGASKTIYNDINLLQNCSATEQTVVTGVNYINGVGYDSSGAKYIFGTVSGTSAYIAKLDANRNVVWAQSISGVAGTSSVTPTKCAFAPDGSIYLSGYYNSNTGYYHGMLIKLNSSGVAQWSYRYFDTNGHAELYDVQTDSSNNVYVVGRASPDNSSSWYGHITKLDSSGNQLFSKKIIGGGASTYFMSMKIDSSGNIYIGGQYGTPSKGLVVKLNTSGNIVWQRYVMHSSNWLGFSEITLDSSDNIYATGYDASSTGILSKFDSSGNHQWSKAFASATLAYCSTTSEDNILASSGTKTYIVDTSGNAVRAFSSNSYIIKAISNNKAVSYGYSASDANTVEFKIDGTASGVLGIQDLAFSSTTPYSVAAVGDGGLTLSSLSIALAISVGSASSSSSNIKTYLTEAVTNNGGMVWGKRRDAAWDHSIQDTSRGAGNILWTNNTNEQSVGNTNWLTAFNGNGFTLGSGGQNASSGSYSSWTFRKAPKFFDVVTYTGNGAVSQAISHSLGIKPGMVIIKRLDTTSDWLVYHTSDNYVKLNLTNQGYSYNLNGSININSTNTFYVSEGQSGMSETNASGGQYVAYLFAHDTSIDGLIQCGEFTATSSAVVNPVNLGWEPQYILVKRLDSAGDWMVFDQMRGLGIVNDKVLYPNASGAESNGGYFKITATGFYSDSSAFYAYGRYAYMAIRRPMKMPTTGTQVFAPYTRGNSGSTASIDVGFAPDLIMQKPRTDSTGFWVNKLVGRKEYLSPSGAYSANIQYNDQYDVTSFNQNGFSLGTYSATYAVTNYNRPADTSEVYWNFRRAPGFFDIVGYTGTSATKTVNHNLGVVPELMIIKDRTGSTSWAVYDSYNGPTGGSYLNATTSWGSSSLLFNNTAPTSTIFTVGSGWATNYLSENYVAYLFASCPGVSKIGTYTGNSSSQTINCGFANGARFVLVKCTTAAGGWVVFDTARGITSGTDPLLLLNSTIAEQSSTDYIDPAVTGFAIKGDWTAVNESGQTYIYLAIA